MEPRDDVVYKQERTVQELPSPSAVSSNKAANANHHDASLDRETQPVVVQLTRVAAAAAASSTQAAGDSSSYLALKSPLSVHLERDFGGSYSRHASVAKLDSDKHDADDDNTDAGRERGQQRPEAARGGGNSHVFSVHKKYNHTVYKYQKNARAIAQAVGQVTDDDERACAARVDTTAATPV
ncbi:hypothetical protein BBAD15_g7314 [Beauveria bassiana D1-5]|uniref:Uncharacterized protein n=1 Tax=Beauveria bassiana D1-5 TaxID=1245745 RepID=A0A0A2VM11_BEABA|nr:hypothetical protein BBAD15_g7314 [Beauveria bassiana D1-5]